MSHKDPAPAVPPQRINDRAPPHDLTVLFERYAQEVYRLCLGMLTDSHEAEDATQEIFLRAHRHWPRYDPQQAAPRTWLGHITMNYCRSLLRRRRRWSLIQRLLPQVPPQWTPPDRRLDVLSAVQALDEHFRSVVLLRYYLELSCTEIALVLGIDASTVRSRLSTARQLLRTHLAEGDEQI
jgi:RNA polymerase sigma-70 factor (ECF subfamily)